MVPFRGRGTSLEPSVIDPGDVERSLAEDNLEAAVRASTPAAAVDGLESINSCLGGSAGGAGRGASAASIRAIGLSAVLISPSGRTEYGGGAGLPLGGSGGGTTCFESAMAAIPNQGSSDTDGSVT